MNASENVLKPGYMKADRFSWKYLKRQDWRLWLLAMYLILILGISLLSMFISHLCGFFRSPRVGALGAIGKVSASCERTGN